MNAREANMIVRRALPEGKIYRRVEFGNFLSTAPPVTFECESDAAGGHFFIAL